MTTNGNIIEWCNSTHQGAPRTGKQICACALDLCDEQSRYLWSKMSVLYLLVTSTQCCSDCPLLYGGWQPSVANQIQLFRKDTFLARRTETGWLRNLTCVVLYQCQVEWLLQLSCIPAFSQLSETDVSSSSVTEFVFSLMFWCCRKSSAVLCDNSVSQISSIRILPFRSSALLLC